VRCRGAAVRNAEGVVTRFAGSFSDITESKLADPLTGLPNRLLFLDVVDRAIKRADRRPDYTFALLVLRLDRFRVVSDGIGPFAADRLLIAVARRLQSGLRATDVVTRDGTEFTLARLGGDEFNVLLDVITDVSDAVRVAERLRRVLEEPFEVDGNRVFLSATMGIAISTTGYAGAEEIVRDATIALNRASASGAMAFEIFDPAMRQRAKSRLQVETDLRHAIDQSAFEMHYQPIVSMGSGRIAGFESLVRWRHPVRGLLSPTEFIPIAEDTGLIVELGRFTLMESCRQMAAWIDRFGVAAPRTVCANVSSREFTNVNLLSQIASTLETAGLSAKNLKLEITESAFLNDVPAAKVTLDAARSMGIEWSLDDFGTGYSSLSYLHGLDVNTLKIDRSFVGGLGAAGNASEMIKAIVALAHTLNMDVVAEGVETAAQFAELQALGCEYAQGFFLSPPVDAVTAGGLIASQPWERFQPQCLQP
jgi:diguanylate cyclase (GGDEF)-like protein